MSARLTFDVFGRRVIVETAERGWKAFYAGSDGKRRPARDIVIPEDIAEAEIERYLADLCHEWASERSPCVRRLES